MRNARATKTQIWPPSRVHRRFPADIRVRIAIIERASPCIIHARLNDLSSGGVNIMVPRDLADGTLAMVGLRFPGTDDAILWFRSKLRHRKGFRCGFQFVDVSAEQKLLLRDLCHSLTD